MRCQYHSNKPCDDCDEHLVKCQNCSHIDSEGDCDNSDSRYYGDWMEECTVCCCLYEEKK